MRKPQGYAVISEIDGRVVEFDSITCAHCSAIVLIGPESELDAGFCRICMKNICGPCADKGTCTPFLKKLERAERKRLFGKALEEALSR